MKRRSLLLVPFALSLLAACGPSPNSFSSPSATYPQPSPSMAPGGLASLLTGQIVSNEEQQLRDIKNRQILLDFPIKVGVVFYQLGSKLEPADQEVEFDATAKAFKDSKLVRESIQIPSNLVSASVTVDEIRRLGARFQCDIMILVSGSHSFEKSKNQNLSFFDTFSDKANYESQVKLEAIALDVYTGTLLSPFDAATKGGPFLLDRAAADYSEQAYAKEKDTESKAWQALRNEAIERLTQLKSEVDKRKASLNDAQPSPAPSPSLAPSTSPSPNPSNNPQGV